MSAKTEPHGNPAHRASDSMWTEYADATTAYMNLQLEVYMAAANADADGEAALNQLLVVAEKRRKTASEAIRRCEQGDLPD